MTNKKNRFFTLIFSCCPGAGEMYFGLYKHGVSLMTLFFGTVAVTCWLNWEELIFLICPVVWCYSFFHTHNLRRLTEEEFSEVRDTFFFEEYMNVGTDWQQMEKYRRLFGVILLILGLSVLWRTGMNLLGSFYYVPEIFWRFGNNIPQIAMAFIVLYAALRLMKVPKTEVIVDFEEEEKEAEAQAVFEAEVKKEEAAVE
ncbi:hypothetical protein [Anaerotignum sp.]